MNSHQQDTMNESTSIPVLRSAPAIGAQGDAPEDKPDKRLAPIMTTNQTIGERITAESVALAQRHRLHIALSRFDSSWGKGSVKIRLRGRSVSGGNAWQRMREEGGLYRMRHISQ